MEYASQKKFFDWGIPVLYTVEPRLRFRRPKADGGGGGGIPGSPSPFGPPGGLPRLFGPGTLTGSKTGVAGASLDAGTMTVALVDLDARVPFLPKLCEAANAAQSKFGFEVLYLGMPAGTIRSDLSPDDGPQFYLPHLEEYLRGTLRRIGTDQVCFLTRHLIAGVEGNWHYANHISANLNDPESKGIVVSTMHAREYAPTVGIPYATGVLYLALTQLLINTGHAPPGGYHPETRGCMFDYCDNLADVAIGLGRMKLDDPKCRNAIKDKEFLAAIDALLALKLEIPDDALHASEQEFVGVGRD